MTYRFFVFIVVSVFNFSTVNALSIDDYINGQLKSYYDSYKEKEYFSGIALSVYVPKSPIRSYYVGKVAHDENSNNVDARTLFEVGSVTKSYISAIILQLEKENKLKMTDELKRFMPEYPKWSNLTIMSLLNMTAGIPNYTDSSLLNYEVENEIKKEFSDSDLIQYVYPPAEFKPPLRTGFHYVNTNYILAGMIIEKVTKNTLGFEIENRILKVVKLKNAFYPIPSLSSEARNYLAHGYQYNPYGNTKLLGKDMRDYNLSSVRASGGVLSNSVDLVRWVKALFVEDTILDLDQKAKLMRLVSTRSGKPIQQTSFSEPDAYGLGVSQTYDKTLGRFWSYEGKMPGYRAMYIYSPAKGIIIACMINSDVDEQNDHLPDLLRKIYLELAKA